MFYTLNDDPAIDFGGARNGVFHKFSDFDGKPIAIIEDAAGTLHMTFPDRVRFKDPLYYKILEKTKK